MAIGCSSFARALALPMLLVAGCAHVEVSTTLSPGADLGGVVTWAPAPAAWDHPVVGDVIDAEIADALALKGYRKTSLAEADVLFAYRASGVRRSKRKNAGDPDADYYVVQDYVAGTVAIDVLERGTRQRLWRGVGEIDLYAESDEEARKAAARAVRAILAEFPEGPTAG